MTKNNLEFSEGYFYLISSQTKIYKELLNCCFKFNIYNKITFQENEKCFFIMEIIPMILGIKYQNVLINKIMKKYYQII